MNHLLFSYRRRATRLVVLVLILSLILSCQVSARAGAATTRRTSETFTRLFTIQDLQTPSLSALRKEVYHYDSFTLQVRGASGKVRWRSANRKVATVTQKGFVRAQRHGETVIEAIVDGIVLSCEVAVLVPEIRISPEELTLHVGQRYMLDYQVSSLVAPRIRSSKTSVAKVNQVGMVTARRRGTAIISFSEDGARETCIVHVVK